MANCTEKSNYHHSDDCVQSGCPSHEAELFYQSTSGMLKFQYAGQHFYMDRSELRIFEELLKKMREYRADL